MNFSNKKILILFFLLMVLLGSTVLLFKNYKLSSSKVNLAEEVKKCNVLPAQIRFSCFRAVLEKDFFANKSIGLKKYLQSLESRGITFHSEDNSYAVFGTNCHTFYHAVGDLIANNVDPKGNLKDSVAYCSNQCTSGCVMGLYKRLALDNQYDENLLKDFYKDCPQGGGHQCAHEIGHVLHDKYVTSILKPIDEISAKNYGLKPQGNPIYTTFDSANIDTPFEDCKKLVPSDELAYCYTGIGHNLFLFSEFSPEGYKQSFNECDKADPSHLNDCYAFVVYRIGINDVATKFLSGKYDEGKAICDDVVNITKNKDMKKHCYLGVGGGIGLFIDSEYSNVPITQDNLKDTQQAVTNYITMCEKSEEAYKQDCYKGLLGTKVRKLYKQLNLQDSVFDDILKNLKTEFEVVG